MDIIWFIIAFQAIQQQYENLTQTLESTSYVSHSQYTESWLRDFLKFAEESREFNVTIDTEEDFIRHLRVSIHSHTNFHPIIHTKY